MIMSRGKIKGICVIVFALLAIGCANRKTITQQMHDQNASPAIIALATYADAQDQYIEAQEVYMPYAGMVARRHPKIHAEIIAAFTEANSLLNHWRDLNGVISPGEKQDFTGWLKRALFLLAQTLEAQGVE